MKKSNRPDRSGEAPRRPAREGRGQTGKSSTWSFSLASERLFNLGASGKTQRVAYRTATGELRFLPT